MAKIEELSKGKEVNIPKGIHGICMNGDIVKSKIDLKGYVFNKEGEKVEVFVDHYREFVKYNPDDLIMTN